MGIFSPKRPDQLRVPKTSLFQWVLGVPRIKRPGRQADHLPIFNVDTKDE